MPEVRALLRLARRNAAAARGRSLLVVGLISLTVGAGVFVATASRTLGVTDDDRQDAQLGGADLALAIDRGDPELVVDEVRAVAAQRGDHISVFRSTEFARVWNEEALITLDLDDPLTDGILDLRVGRAPVAPDEIAVTSELLDRHDAAIGERIDLAFTGGSWLVVGEVVHPFNGDLRAAVMTEAGFEASGREGLATILVGGERVIEERLDYLFIEGGWWTGRHMEEWDDNPGIDFSQPEQLSTAVSLLLLIEAATVAAAVFTVGTRRRLTEFGQLAVVGATGRQLRVLVLAESLVLAGAGTLVGVLVGFGAYVAVAPMLADLVNRTPTAVEWSVLDLVGPVIAGTLAAVLAAWWPARRVARIEPVRALAGRFDPAAFSPRLSVVGGLLIGFGLLGFGAVTASDTTASDLAGVALVASLVTVFIGTAICAGPLVTVLGRGAGALRGLPRLVVRDSGRQPVRAGASIAALLIIVGVPVLAGTLAASNPWAEDRSWTGGDVVLVNDLAAIDSGHLRSARDAIDAIEPLDVQELAVESLSPAGSVVGTAELRATRDLRWYTGVADGDLIELLDFDGQARRALEAGAVVAGDLASHHTSSDGRRVTVDQVAVGDGEVLPVGARLPNGRNGYPLPEIWVSPETAARLELEPVSVGQLVRFEHPIGSNGLDRVRQEFADALFEQDVPPADAVGMMFATYSVGGAPSGLDRSEIVALVLAGCMLLALLIGAVGAALSAVELDRELGTLVAIGAAPAVRRRFIGLQSGYHTFLAGLLATPIAVAIVWVLYRSEDGYYYNDVVVHRWAVVAVLVGLPLAVAAMMAALFRSGRPTVSRRLS